MPCQVFVQQVPERADKGVEEGCKPRRIHILKERKNGDLVARVSDLENPGLQSKNVLSKPYFVGHSQYLLA